MSVEPLSLVVMLLILRWYLRTDDCHFGVKCWWGVLEPVDFGTGRDETKVPAMLTSLDLCFGLGYGVLDRNANSSAGRLVHVVLLCHAAITRYQNPLPIAMRGWHSRVPLGPACSLLTC